MKKHDFCPDCGYAYATMLDGTKKCMCKPYYSNQKEAKIEDNNVKDTNPKDAIGIAKVPYSTIPANVIAEVGLALMEGARKYRRHNYRIAGVRASVYYDACLRHIGSWWEGEDIDPDSGLSHVTKAIAGLIVLRDSMLMENWNDDRPPKVKQGWIKNLNEKAKEIIAKYPDGKEPYTEKQNSLEELPPIGATNVASPIPMHMVNIINIGDKVILENRGAIDNERADFTYELKDNTIYTVIDVLEDFIVTDGSNFLIHKNHFKKVN